MFGLRNQVAGHIVRTGRFISDQDDLAGAGDAVDVDLAENVPFGQGHEQVSRPDDLVDPFDPLNAVGQSRHPLGTADAIHFCDAQFVTRRQNVVVVTAKSRRRDDHRDVAHSRHSGRDCRHQQSRRIGRRSTRNANSDALERQIPLPELDPPPHGGRFLDDDVAVEQAGLEIGDIGDYAPQRGQKSRLGLSVCRGEFGWRNPERLCGQFFAVQTGRVIQDGRQSLTIDISADSFDDLLRGQRLAEKLDGSLSPHFGDNVAAGAQALTQVGHQAFAGLTGPIGRGNVQGQ